MVAATVYCPVKVREIRSLLNVLCHCHSLAGTFDYAQHWTLLGIAQNSCKHENLLGNNQWRAVVSIKHCEKRLPLN